MKTVFEHLRSGLHKRLDLNHTPERVDPLELKVTEWSHRFERLQRERMLIGALRYGRLNKPGKPLYNRCEDIKRRIVLYEKTGNQEYLVDAANLCLLEFEEGVHPNKHFNAEDDGTHTKEL